MLGDIVLLVRVLLLLALSCLLVLFTSSVLASHLNACTQYNLGLFVHACKLAHKGWQRDWSDMYMCVLWQEQTSPRIGCKLPMGLHALVE